MSKHTPGPWVSKQDGKYRDSPWSIDHEDGHDASWAPISTEKGRTLAIVVNDDSKRPMGFQGEEMHANASLIAAAPDLLEALEAFERIKDIWLPAEAEEQHAEEMHTLHMARNSMIAAIARAKGESQ